MDGLRGFRGLFRLALGEIRGFQSARIVFVLRLARFVRGLSMRGACGLRVQLRFAAKLRDDLFDESPFVHKSAHRKTRRAASLRDVTS
jgi:hypothetical protein